MKLIASAAAVSVSVLSVLTGVAASAQGRQPASATGDVVTLTACVVREADYARSTGPQSAGAPEPQLLLANAQTGMPSHSVTGVRESELSQHIGQRVEISGTVERPRTTAITSTADGNRAGVITKEAPGAAGVTPEGAAAHEPADALAATVQTGKVGEPDPRSADPAYRVATLPRLNATSYKRLAGACAKPAGEQTASARPAVTQTPVRTVSQPAPQAAELVTARGCLVRQTPGGTALTPDGSLDPLVLRNASLVVAPAFAGNSAVPGSTPNGSGSGTVGVPVGTTGAAPVDVGKESFALTTSASAMRELAGHVGERVEIVGAVSDTASGVQRGAEAAARAAQPAGDGAPGRAEAAPDTAHPSAAARVIAVSSFRAIGGTCN